MLFHPRGIAVHPCLQKLFAGLADAASLIEQPLFGLDEGLGLAKRWGVQVRQNVTQMLLRHGGAGGAYRNTQYAAGLPAQALSP